MARGTKPTPTLNQTRFIALFSEALIKKKPFTLIELLRKAGYSEATANQQINIMAGLKPHIQPTIDWMEKHRVKVQDKMDTTIDGATYGDLTRSLDILTKSMQLLGGK